MYSESEKSQLRVSSKLWLDANVVTRITHKTQTVHFRRTEWTELESEDRQTGRGKLGLLWLSINGLGPLGDDTQHERAQLNFFSPDAPVLCQRVPDIPSFLSWPFSGGLFWFVCAFWDTYPIGSCFTGDILCFLLFSFTPLKCLASILVSQTVLAAQTW